MKPFEDLFDTLDDKSDALEFASDTLDEYYLSGHLNIVLNDEEKEGGEEEGEEEEKQAQAIENDNAMDTNDVEIIDADDEDTEDVLSHKLSQLSTKNDNDEKTSVGKKRQRSSTPPASPSHRGMPKKLKNKMNVRVNTHGKEEDPIPTYLLSSNQSFEQMLQPLINQTPNSSVTMDDLRQLAVLKHHIMDLRIQKEIRTVYLQSGTGTLREAEPELIETDRRVWPSQVKTEMLKQQTAAAAATATDKTSTRMETGSVTSDREPDHVAYESFLRSHLQQLTDQITHYQQKYADKKNALSGLTSAMEMLVRDYVYEHGIKPLQMKHDLKITLLNYDYDAEILQRKYLQEHPNPYQINIEKRLCELRTEAEKSKRDLIELQQRVFFNKPSPTIDATVPTSLATATTTAMSIHDEKIVQRKKIDLIAVHIKRAEMRYDHDRILFYEELAKMWQNHRNLVKDQGITTTMANLIDRRVTNITEKFRELYRYRLKFYLRSPYGDLELGKDPNMKTIGFLSPLIIDILQHPFADQQIQLLNRGPTYVPPYQLHISSSCQSMDDVLRKLYAPLKHQLAALQTKYNIDVHHLMHFDDFVYQQFKEAFSASIPLDFRQRALYEMKLVHSIRVALREHQLILRRTADNRNTFYLGSRQEFEVKADDYLTNTDAYELLMTLDDEMDQQRQIQTQVNDRTLGINRALKILQRTSALKKEVVQKLLRDPSQTQLPYLYFLPDVSQKNEMKLVPMITSSHSSPQAKVATFLQRLLHGFAQEKMQSATFSDEVDFMQKLKHHAHVQHRLTPTTLFCTIKITNYYTLDTNETMIEKVLKFLQDNTAANYLHRVSFATIRNLLQLVLLNHIFGYKNRIYTINKGLPSTMPLSETLANIYLHQWQRMFVDRVALNQGLFGRYKDQIFFTWKASEDELGRYLQTIKEKSPNVYFETSVGLSVHYLDAYVDNRNGQLYSRVYHHPVLQSYTLPYVVGHSKVQHSHWLRFALIRAACYCSSVEDFNQERIYLELTYLANGYSLLFVETHVQHFFSHFNAEQMRYSSDQAVYDIFRGQWFDFMTSQRELSHKLQEIDDQGRLLRLTYLYEYGQKTDFNRKFHQLWTQHLRDHPQLSDKDLTVVLSSKHVHSLNTLLTQHKSTL